MSRCLGHSLATIGSVTQSNASRRHSECQYNNNSEGNDRSSSVRDCRKDRYDAEAGSGKHVDEIECEDDDMLCGLELYLSPSS
jgi:hypothetical protein